MLEEIARHYVPGLVLAASAPGDSDETALLHDRPMIGGLATAYVCRGRVCDLPVTDPAALAAQLAQAVKNPL
jgi:uncharacterized protein YyaL (SSP411 family)